MVKISDNIDEIIEKYGNSVLRQKDFVLSFFKFTNIKPTNTKIIEYYISVLLFLSSYEKITNEQFISLKSYYLSQIIKYFPKKNVTMSVFNGLTGIGYAINCSDNKNQKIQNLKLKFNKLYISVVQKYRKALKTSLSNNLVEADYDLIEGYSAIILYLLNTDSYKNNKMIFNNLVNDLTCFINNNSLVIKSENMILPYLSKMYPNGAINYSLSHGLAGPLLTLTKIEQQNLGSYKAKKAIRKLLDIYNSNITIFEDKIWWPTRKASNISTCYSKFPRASWCYGSPGIVNALYNGANLLKDNKTRKNAEKGLLTLTKMNFESLDLDSPTVCHGLSGLLLCIENMNQKMHNTNLECFEEKITSEILKFADYNYKFIFRNYDYPTPFKLDSKKIFQHDIGLLTGSTGVILTLINKKYKNNDAWLKMLALY